MHPFLADEFLFDWSSLKPENVEPDIREALRRARANVDALVSRVRYSGVASNA